MCISKPLTPRPPSAPVLRRRPWSAVGSSKPALRPRPPSAPPTAPPKERSPQVGRCLTWVEKHSNCHVLAKNYNVIRRIGQGTFGRMDLVRHIASGEERVCKRVKLTGTQKDLLRRMRTEMLVLSRLDHPNIVKMYELVEDMDIGELMLVLEYIPGGNCRSLLRQEGGSLPEAMAAGLVRQLLVAVSYCHEHGIVHRDIKPENMMISKRRLVGTLDCKVIDFGLAACENAGDESSASSVGARMFKQQGVAQRAGTPAYMAPEVADRWVACSAKGDVWSAGVVALELVTGRQLFAGSDSQEIYARIRAFCGEQDLAESMAWQSLSQEGKRFVSRLLEVCTSQRPSASEALEHQWLQPDSTLEVGLPGRLARSLASYSRAKPVMRQCLNLLAFRSSGADFRNSGADLRALDSAFVRADKNSQGHVSLREIAASCAQSGCGLPSADWDAVESVSYTEFIAACLSMNYVSPRKLAVSTFKAIDVDSDGQISLGDIPDLISDRSLLGALPRGRTFGLEEWVEGFQTAIGESSSGHVSKLRLSVAGTRFLATPGS